MSQEKELTISEKRKLRREQEAKLTPEQRRAKELDKELLGSVTSISSSTSSSTSPSLVYGEIFQKLLNEFPLFLNPEKILETLTNPSLQEGMVHAFFISVGNMSGAVYNVVTRRDPSPHKLQQAADAIIEKFYADIAKEMETNPNLYSQWNSIERSYPDDDCLCDFDSPDPLIHKPWFWEKLFPSYSPEFQAIKKSLQRFADINTWLGKPFFPKLKNASDLIFLVRVCINSYPRDTLKIVERLEKIAEKLLDYHLSNAPNFTPAIICLGAQLYNGKRWLDFLSGKFENTASRTAESVQDVLAAKNSFSQMFFGLEAKLKKTVVVLFLKERKLLTENEVSQQLQVLQGNIQQKERELKNFSNLRWIWTKIFRGVKKVFYSEGLSILQSAKTRSAGSSLPVIRQLNDESVIRGASYLAPVYALTFDCCTAYSLTTTATAFKLCALPAGIISDFLEKDELVPRPIPERKTWGQWLKEKFREETAISGAAGLMCWLSASLSLPSFLIVVTAFNLVPLPRAILEWWRRSYHDLPFTPPRLEFMLLQSLWDLYSYKASLTAGRFVFNSAPVRAMLDYAGSFFGSETQVGPALYYNAEQCKEQREQCLVEIRKKLGAKSDASVGELRHVVRQSLEKVHPDKITGQEETTKELSTIMEVLRSSLR
jgi:hypothetical protein